MHGHGLRRRRAVARGIGSRIRDDRRTSREPEVRRDSGSGNTDRRTAIRSGGYTEFVIEYDRTRAGTCDYWTRHDKRRRCMVVCGTNVNSLSAARDVAICVIGGCPGH